MSSEISSAYRVSISETIASRVDLRDNREKCSGGQAEVAELARWVDCSHMPGEKTAGPRYHNSRARRISPQQLEGRPGRRYQRSINPPRTNELKSDCRGGKMMGLHVTVKETLREASLTSLSPYRPYSPSLLFHVSFPGFFTVQNGQRRIRREHPSSPPTPLVFDPVLTVATVSLQR